MRREFTKVLMSREGLKLLTNVHDFTTLLLILRRESFEWLEQSMESDLGIRFATRSFDLAFHDITFFKHSF